jgi:hypothetical protein
VAAICASEVVLVFVDLRVGVILHVVVLGAIFSLQASRSGDIEGRAMVPLALVPLLRILSLTMPAPGIPPIYWTLLVGAPLAIGGVVATRAAGLSRREVGLKWSAWPPQAAIAALGLPLGLAAWYLGRPPTFINEGATPAEIILVGLLLLLFVAVTEEFIFRGVLQAGLSLAHAESSILLGALLYGTMYLGSLSPRYAVVMALTGFVYGLAVHRTGSIAGVSASHAILVLGTFLVWPALLG